MKKKEIILISVIGSIILALGVLGSLVLRGVIGPDKGNTEKQTAPDSSTAVAINEQKEKDEEPVSPVALLFDAEKDSSPYSFSLLGDFGVNSVIFNLTEKSKETVESMLSLAKSSGLYAGAVASYQDDNTYIEEFVKNSNVNFIVINNLDESLSDFSDKFTALRNKIKELDPAIKVGFEPTLLTNVSDNLKQIYEYGLAEIVFIRETEANREYFKNCSEKWSEFPAEIIMCHDITGLNDYTPNDASDVISAVSASLEMEQCNFICLSPYNEYALAGSVAAKTVRDYVKNKETELLDKDFKITNQKSTTITVSQSFITFTGTSSPLYDLKCNGKKLTVADNGDFSVECKLQIGVNIITFEHKGKTYKYTVKYNVKLIKEVSPSAETSVPGGISVELSAVAHKDAKVTLEFNGKTYSMKKGIYEGTDSAGNEKEIGEDFAYYYVSVKVPEGKSKEQNLGSFTVTAKYSGVLEHKTGAKIKVSANIIENTPEIPSESTATTSKKAETTKKETTTKGTATRTTRTTTQKAEESALTNENGETYSIVESSTHRSHTTEKSTTEKPTETTSASTTASATSSPKSNSLNLEKYDYKKNYGKGTAKICEITDDYVETFDGNTDKTYSVPDCSPLLKGTVDYVRSSAVCDGDTYYFLKSGVKVPLLHEENTASGTDTKIYHLKVTDGYIMPKNNINVLYCNNLSDRTVIKLEMNRKVAFNVKLLGQTYGSYNGRLVTVSNVNCTGLEFTFSDTETATGNFGFSGSIVKSAGFTKTDSGIKLTLNFSNAGRFYGYHVEYDTDGNLVLTIKQKPGSLSGYTIMLDPGHGGYDGGATCVVSNANYSCEKKITLDIAERTRDMLLAEGARVIMTRTNDSMVSLSDRNAMVRNYLPDMFISIHCDSSTGASAYGTSAYYYRAFSQPLAKAIHSALVSAYKSTIYASDSSKIDRGTSFFAYKVARVEECPAVLIEYGFVSNTAECEKLQNASTREVLAKATVQGIKNYIANN